jgi:hypothetical protein
VIDAMMQQPTTTINDRLQKEVNTPKTTVEVILDWKARLQQNSHA